MCSRAVEGAGLGKQRVDTAGRVALEVVSARRSPLEHLGKLGPFGTNVIGAQDPVDDRVSISVKCSDDLVD
ncbi:MAG TPA: hypothetical protein VIO16_13020 [Dehalococcoidia bacterium]